MLWFLSYWHTNTCCYVSLKVKNTTTRNCTNEVFLPASNTRNLSTGVLKLSSSSLQRCEQGEGLNMCRATCSSSVRLFQSAWSVMASVECISPDAPGIQFTAKVDLVGESLFRFDAVGFLALYFVSYCSSNCCSIDPCPENILNLIHHKTNNMFMNTKSLIGEPAP